MLVNQPGCSGFPCVVLQYDWCPAVFQCFSAMSCKSKRLHASPDTKHIYYQFQHSHFGLLYPECKNTLGAPKLCQINSVVNKYKYDLSSVYCEWVKGEASEKLLGRDLSVTRLQGNKSMRDVTAHHIPRQRIPSVAHFEAPVLPSVGSMRHADTTAEQKAIYWKIRMKRMAYGRRPFLFF